LIGTRIFSDRLVAIVPRWTLASPQEDVEWASSGKIVRVATQDCGYGTVRLGFTIGRPVSSNGERVADAPRGTVTTRQPLSLDTYRALVALDQPFDADVATSARLPALVDQAIAFLEAETHNGRRRGMRAGPSGSSHLAEARRSLRALLTVRPPAPLPEHAQEWLDAILRHDREATPVVDVASLPRLSFHVAGGTLEPRATLVLWQGDITCLAIDAIVNAANSQMLGCFVPFHACIDNAIHSVAGPRLREDCARIMAAQGSEEPTGVAKVTRGYHLPARFVLHTVGPIVRGPLTGGHRDDLARCYTSCLELAAAVGTIRSVAFCAISTGVFGFPKVAAAEIAVRTVSLWLDAHPGVLSTLVFNVFGDDDREVYEAVLRSEGPPR